MRLLLTDDFLRYDVERLVPRNRNIFGLAPILRVAFPVRIEIHPLEGRQNPVWGIDVVLECQRMGRNARLAQRREGFAACLYAPAWCVAVGEFYDAGAKDLAVLHIDMKRPAVRHLCKTH